ncbi:putative nuclease HARBI1 [Saccostrea echinata]|uniref:putative nuclease HARBI1 n=1 Tax=Saccostrea echinata TaxID=191078 RepID=UPI002A83ED8D|nr:putative nuclease HARBI1 [Saccostrea echinata]
MTLIEHKLINTTKNQALPPLLQLLVCLRFLATGAFHKLIGDSVNVSECTVGRCCRSVTQAINDIRQDFIMFPRDQTARQTKQEFLKIAGFPNVLGCVDGTFVKKQGPSENEPDFVNRKGFHSLNVQMVCDAKFRITSICANWPGSVHDSRIWRESALCRQFERGEHKGLLLGDSGYPCRRFLMTPYLSPTTEAQQRFNASLCRTRVLVEQSFGILKRRFSCLQGTLRTCPDQAAAYIVACVVLHNIGIERGDIAMDRQDVIHYNPTDHHVAWSQGSNFGLIRRFSSSQVTFGAMTMPWK